VDKICDFWPISRCISETVRGSIAWDRWTVSCTLYGLPINY